MAVLQEKKQKVRPVLDYRELNQYIDSYTADADVCAEKLRTWRRMGLEIAALDLKSAYLQIHLKKSLWQYQTVFFEGRRWALTRLGFGMNVSPTIMRAIVNRVLSLDASVREGTSSYVDDILVREDVVSAQYVKQHLARYGLQAKEPERAVDGTRLLGLAVRRENGRLLWTRGSEVDAIPDQLSRRSVFSIMWEADRPLPCLRLVESGRGLHQKQSQHGHTELGRAGPVRSRAVLPDGGAEPSLTA